MNDLSYLPIGGLWRELACLAVPHTSSPRPLSLIAAGHYPLHGVGHKDNGVKLRTAALVGRKEDW